MPSSFKHLTKNIDRISLIYSSHTLQIIHELKGIVHVFRELQKLVPTHGKLHLLLMSCAFCRWTVNLEHAILSLLSKLLVRVLLQLQVHCDLSIQWLLHPVVIAVLRLIEVLASETRRHYV